MRIVHVRRGDTGREPHLAALLRAGRWGRAGLADQGPLCRRAVAGHPPLQMLQQPDPLLQRRHVGRDVQRRSQVLLEPAPTRHHSGARVSDEKEALAGYMPRLNRRYKATYPSLLRGFRLSVKVRARSDDYMGGPYLGMRLSSRSRELKAPALTVLSKF
jgi:hypothetical protein